jgi:hypothetical protein
MTDYDQQRDHQRHIFVSIREDDDDAAQTLDVHLQHVDASDPSSLPGIMKLHDKLMYRKKEILDCETNPDLVDVLKSFYLIASAYRQQIEK